MDFDEREDQEEVEGVAVQPGYDSIGCSALQKAACTAGGEGALTTAPNSRKTIGTPNIRYKECLKNHAASIGGQAVDGCGEFISAGEEGALDALKCAACNCHRNFHRKEGSDGGGVEEGIYQYRQHHRQLISRPYYHLRAPTGCLHLNPPPQHKPLALPAASGEGCAGGSGYSKEEEDVSNQISSGVSGGGGKRASWSSKKRFRTKFTQERRGKMLSFAERLGWRIQKHDEAAVEQFCTENDVKRHALKVWMHNNKYTVGKKP